MVAKSSLDLRGAGVVITLIRYIFTPIVQDVLTSRYGVIRFNLCIAYYFPQATSYR